MTDNVLKSQAIYKQIAAIMNDVDAIAKSRPNSGQNYKFRGIDDVYNALHPLLSKHRVFTVPEVIEDRSEERTNVKGNTLIYRILKVKYYFFAEDGSSITAVVMGEGMDPGDKASNKAMSAAHKYALLQVFAIPTEDSKDSEEASHELKSKLVYTGKEAGQNNVLRGIFEHYKIPAEKRRDVAVKLVGQPMDRLDEYVGDIASAL